MKRADRIRQIQSLRAQGHTVKEVAAQIGLSAKTVSTYMADPEGSNLKRFRKNHARPCPCGRGVIVDKRAQQCVQCRNEQLSAREKRWNRERIIGAFQRFYFETGLAPTELNVLHKNQGHYPSTTAVMRHIGSWEEAVIAAGFPPWEPGRQKRKVR